MKNFESATVMEIDTKAFKNNMQNIQKIVGKDKTLIPVVKANGYGTYINKNMELMNDFKILAVARSEEGVDLRNNGYKKEIVMINQPYIGEIDDIIENNLEIGLSSKEFLDEIIKRKLNVKVHIEVETGMNRTGFLLNELEDVCKKIKENSNIEVIGIYTHLSNADVDEEYTNMQFEKFTRGVKIVQKYFNKVKYIHMSASNGLMYFKNQDICNSYRPGIIMYGYPSSDRESAFKLEPIAKLKSKITYIKEIEAGESVGYGRAYKTTKKTKIATIPIGYADGLRRSLFEKGNVVINGTICPIIGKICMDSIMADITKIDAKVNDDVYIWDNEKITLEDIAKEYDTINYEVISTIADRVPRVFKD